MEQTLQRILAGVYVLIGLVGVLVIPLVYIILSQLDRRGGDVPINVFQTALRVFGLVGKTAKRGVYELRVKLQKPKKLKNLGQTPVVQDVDQSLVQIMARYILAELDTKLLDEVDLSETKWIRRGEWKNVTNKTPEQWRAVMDRLEASGIVERKGAKRTRVLSASKRPSTAAKLKAVVNNSPSIH